MSVVVDDFLVIESESNDEDEMNHLTIVNKKPTIHKHDDNNSIAGWSEVSAPSVRSLQSSLIGRNSPSPRNKKSSISSTDYILFPSTTSSKNNKNEEELTRNTSTNIPFSWAEITKIQPTYHKTTSLVSQINTCSLSDKENILINKKIKNDNTNDDENKSVTEFIDDKLPRISEEDCHATKEDFGRNAKRAGKKGSRIKYPNGKKGSRRNNNRK